MQNETGHVSLFVLAELFLCGLSIKCLRIKQKPLYSPYTWKTKQKSGNSLVLLLTKGDFGGNHIHVLPVADL